jgi:hypothetical protein
LGRHSDRLKFIESWAGALTGHNISIFMLLDKMRCVCHCTAPLAKLGQGESGVPANLVRMAWFNSCHPSTKPRHASCFPPSSMLASIELSIKLIVCLSATVWACKHYFVYELDYWFEGVFEDVDNHYFTNIHC